MRALVTGGAGFIGSQYVRAALGGEYPGLEDAELVVLDALTYAGTMTNLTGLLDDPRLRFVRGDDGLPQEGAYLSVLREAMARDSLDPVGVTFGTKTGQLWHSSDEGESWRLVTGNLPEIWAVEAAVRD